MTIGEVEDAISLADLADAPILALDADLHCRHANEAWESVTGQPRADALGAGWKRCLKADELGPFLRLLSPEHPLDAPVSQTLRLGQPEFATPFEFRARRGPSGWWLVARALPALPGSDKTGTASALAGAMIAASTPDACTSGEQRFRRVFEHAPTAIAFTSADGTILECNPAGRRLLLSGEDIVCCRALADIVHPEDRAAFGAALAALANGKQREFSTELRCIGREGQVLWKQIIVSRIDNLAGASGQLLALLTDCTAARQDQLALRRSHQKLQATLDSISDGVTVFDADWRITAWSGNAQKMLDITPEALIGRVLWEAFPLAIGTEFETAYRRAARTGEPQHFEEYYPEPLNMWLECHCYPADNELTVYFRDISERRRSQQRLLDSQAAFARLIESNPFGMYTVDADFRLSHLSRGARQAFGGNESLEGRDFGDVIRAAWTEPFASRVIARFRYTLETGESYQEPSVVEHRLDRGAVEAYDWRIERLTMPDGRPGVVCHFYDLSERQRLEAALRESEMRFRAMADGLPLIVWVHDEKGRQIWVNQTFCEFFGIERERLGPSGWQAVVHDDDAPAYIAAFADAVARQEPFHAEVRVMRPDGCWHWIENWARPRFDGDGKFLGHVGTSLDITERRNAESALRESELRFRGLAESMPHSVWMCDATGQNIYNNTTFYQYTGLQPGDGAGSAWLACCHPEDRQRIAEAWRATVGSNGAIAYDVEARVRRHDGAWRWFHGTGAPVRDEEGRVVRWVGTMTDVHEQRQLMAALHDADRRKDHFLATLAHELRNPLAAVTSAVQVLDSRAPQDPPLRLACDVVARQSRHLARLIDDLMDAGRIQLGRIKLQREPVDLVGVLASAVETVQPLLAAKSHRLEQHGPAARPLRVDGDPARLSQLFQNLLGNAARYTPDRGIVRLELEEIDGRARVRVSDNGIGISEQDLGRIFEMFTQGDNADATAQGGLGIGLYLVQELVTLHGGTVRAESAGPGRGSCFTVELPLAASTAADEPLGEATQPSPDAADAVAQRVLVVDDNDDAAQCTGLLLELMGHQVRLARDGLTAIAEARQWQPTVVLLDIGLPDMSGEDVARAIRAQPWGPVRLVAVTGWGRDEDRHRTRDAGFDAHMVKPVDIENLEACLRSAPAAPSGRA